MTFSRCILFLGGSLCEKSVPNWHNLHYDNDHIVSWNHQVISLQIDLNYTDIIPTPRAQKTPTWTPFQCCFAVTFIAFTYRIPAYHFLCLISTLQTTLSLYHCNMCHHLSLCCSSDCSWDIHMQQSGWIVHLDQNSSSAFLQRDCLSRARRASTSATDSSPWTLLSLVRTLTPLVIFSFSPTTAKTWEDTTAWHSPSHTTHTATLTHCPLCATEFNNCGWLASLEVHLVYIQTNKTLF